tara:strand:+ start:2144 stop:2644 length:501 start_codon:yes stop_codon:yes gene_type:complete
LTTFSTRDGLQTQEARMSGYVNRSLDFTGRTGVLKYWRAQRALIWFLMLGIALAMGLLVSPLPQWTAAVGLVPILYVYVASIALGVRRLHDRGRSGWWLMIYSSPLAFSCVLLARNGGLPGEPSSPVFITTGVAVLAAFAFYVWGFIDIGVRKGRPGPNRYGPVPT